MTTSHLKRLASPKTWPIHKKTLTFVTRPQPGPHKMEHQLPISVILRDLLGVVSSNKEAKRVLHNKDCLIDGTNAYDDKRPAGIMDVVSIPSTGKNYRIVVNKKNKLVAIEVSGKEANQKTVTVMRKTILKGGKVQVSTNDGRNFLVEKDEFKVGDGLLIEVPSQKIIQKLPLEKGAVIKLTGGSHVGTLGTVEKIENEIIYFKTDKEQFHTHKKYAMVVGEGKPAITIQK
jgi:small subunit ribosomal protein S4e